MEKRVNHGKKFEADWKKSVPPDVYYYRLRDGTASWGNEGDNVRFQQTNDYDCLMFKSPFFFAIELKSYDGSSFQLSSIRENQISGLTNASKYENSIAGIVFDNRRDDVCHFVLIRDINQFIKTSKRKSIPNAWIAENGIQIAKWKKKVHYNYDIRRFIDHFDGF